MKRTAALLVLVVALSAVAVPVGGHGDSDDHVGTVVLVSVDGNETVRQEAATTVRNRLNVTDGYNGTVTATDDGVRIEIEPAAPPYIVDRLTQRGNFSLTAQTPNRTGVALLTNSDVLRVGEVTTRNGVPVLPLRLTPESTRSFAGSLQRLGFTGSDGIDACSGQGDNATGYCLVTRLNGEVINAAGVTGNLANAVEGTYFNRTQAFVIAANESESLERVRLGVLAPPLPESATTERVRNVTTFEWTPTPSPTEPTDGGAGPGLGPVAALLAVVLAALAQMVRN